MALNPLALTQVLPFLPLAQGDIDYETERRGEPDLLQTVLAEPATTVMLTCDGRVAVPRGQGAMADYENASMRLATLPGAYAAKALERHPQAVAMFLGGYSGAKGVRHVIAVDITRVVAANGDDDCNNGDSGTVDGQLAGYGRSTPGSAAGQGDDAAANGGADLLQQAEHRFDWVDLRGFAPHANAREAGQATSAVALSVWHNRQRHCPACGAPVEAAMGGWAQRCTEGENCGRLLFPRVEPAVITLVVDSADRLLIQHNAAWNNPTLYSVSAGFVEAGENLEHAVRREAKEETGITLGEVKYLGSQPWPYPASLMVAFKAHALGTDVHVDGSETVDAQWMTRDEYTSAIITGRISAPGKATIARYMIEQWLGHELG
ncbi:NAD(+) diphosphatase [Bifidobacterium sp. 64T4]|uniref:NAD(+) diphosphatase n=1 Tax=Bifidobacterium pongonis TaxID=2834432 RepID=UPI001C58059C|nr:NAD(+) diphosphatase [Bifidobacterium pongonis]MBW3094916.1 NAD(+) diphosphatase [Bifidobacterium pongonis]